MPSVKYVEFPLFLWSDIMPGVYWTVQIKGRVFFCFFKDWKKRESQLHQHLDTKSNVSHSVLPTVSSVSEMDRAIHVQALVRPLAHSYETAAFVLREGRSLFLQDAKAFVEGHVCLKESQNSYISYQLRENKQRQRKEGKKIWSPLNISSILQFCMNTSYLPDRLSPLPALPKRLC